MQVQTVTKPHPLAHIAEAGAAPMARTLKLRTGNPDKTSGMMWAQQAIALCVSQATPWTKLALELFPMNTEQRESALNTWKAWKAAKTKAFKAGEELSPQMDEKTFKRIMATATVRMSHLSTICKAMDAGMDEDTLIEHYELQGLRVSAVADLSIDSIYQVAKQFTGSKAGRPQKTFREKLIKLIEDNEEDCGDDGALWAAVAKLLA